MKAMWGEMIIVLLLGEHFCILEIFYLFFLDFLTYFLGLFIVPNFCLSVADVEKVWEYQ